MMEKYEIRRETGADTRATETLVRDAFWNVYRPGCSEHYVLHTLRNSPAFVPQLNLVLQVGQALAAQVVFMRAEIAADDGRSIPVLTFGPFCTAPAFRRQGYGEALLHFALQQAAQMGAGAVCIEGDAAYYAKYGFVPAHTVGIRYYAEPDGDAPYFLVKELQSGFLRGVTGVYHTPQDYFVQDADVETFDAQFPPKEKKVLPGQLV